MKSSLVQLLALGLAPSVVLGDFYIYKGGSNVPSDGGGGGVATNDAFFLNAVPDCDDLNNSVAVANPENDASSRGWACDGCDAGTAIADWDITRFEAYDGNDAIGGSTDSPECLTSGCTGSITLYRRDDGGYDLVGRNGDQSTNQGSCERTSADEIGPCDIIATDAVQIFHCTTALTINSASGN